MAKKTTSKRSRAVKKIECQNCGVLNSAKSKFCSSCGSELMHQTKMENKAEVLEQQSKKIIQEHPEHGTVIFGKFKPRFFLIIGVVIMALVVGYVLLSSNHSSVSQNPMLNNTNSSRANICTSDSQCPTGDYCSSFGACLVATCGDGICTSQERQSSSCPIDCGCSSGYVVNRHTNMCQLAVNMSYSAIQSYVGNYLKQLNITGTITSVNSTYYGNQSAEEAVVNCQPKNSSYPCQMIFYFNNNGNIINVTRSD